MARTLMFLLVLLCSSATLVTCSSAGLHMKLTHVDDKGSYTTAKSVRRAVAITRQRLVSMKAAGGDVSAPVHWATQQYIAEYLIGDPPQRAEALIDTGSDLVWTQCMTCSARNSCFKQSLPYYNFSESRSMRPVPCTDGACLATDEHRCFRDGGCAFNGSYDAGDITGLLGTEVFTFQSGAAKLAFGCVSATNITKGALQGASGLIGLGRGRLSLVSQTGANKFSYCLTPYFHNNGASSHLFVGASASLSGGGGPVMSIPFVKSPKDYTFYYLPLVGITVGKTKLPIPSTVFDLHQVARGSWVGGVIIDSGSPFTSLVDDAYQALSEELTRQLNRSLVTPPADTELEVELCVARDDVDKVVPPLVLHFTGGADMALPPENYWAPVDNSKACMVIFNGDDMSLIGNFQQQNMNLLYDLGRGQLSFQTADCTAL